jgi:YD repeat-containing protein
LGYDGSLVTSATLAGGPVSGTVSYAYDSFFRPTGIAVNGDTVTLAYDRDGLLRTAGALAIKRNPINGLADSTTLDAVATAYRYDSTGAIAGATTTANGVVLYDYTLERDRLDRITRRIETVSGVTIDTRSPYSTRSATVLASIR